MSTYSRAAGRARLRAVPPDNQSVPAIDPVRAIDPMHAMHSALGDVRDEEVLVIGPHGLETMCDLLHRGARSVMLLRMDVRPDAQSASLVVVPEAPLKAKLPPPSKNATAACFSRSFSKTPAT